MTDRTRRRIGTVVLAPIAALSAWAFLRLVGVDLVTTGNGTVGPYDVVAAALVGALGGWFALRMLERRSRRPGYWWPALGSTALAVSTIGPSHLADGAGAALALTSLHFVTAIVVITGFATTLPTCCDRTVRRGGVPRGDPAP
jgi:Family of unknown function (DUF6069)